MRRETPLHLPAIGGVLGVALFLVFAPSAADHGRSSGRGVKQVTELSVYHYLESFGFPFG